MKKILICFILLICASVGSSANINAHASSSIYAKIEKSDVYFYALPDDSSSLFILPESYFVKLTGEQGGFYSAHYQDLKGYVKKGDVTPMRGTPLTPYFTENFRAFLPDGIGLFTQPKMSESYQMLTIPYLYENLNFYGEIIGDVAIPDKGGLWYYCKYQDQYGYVYSVFCDKLQSPPQNNERFSLATTPNFNTKQKVEKLSTTAMAFIIIGVSLPCLIVLYLLIKPNMQKQILPKEKTTFKARKRRDYFEFDEADLN